MKSSTKSKLVSVATLASLNALLLFSTSASAAIIALAPGSTTSFPTSVPTFNVRAGDPIALSVWAQAQGTGYLQNASFAVYEGSAASWNGGIMDASNPFPSVNFVTGTSAALPIPTQFAGAGSLRGVEGVTLSTTGTAGVVTAPVAAYSAGVLPWIFGGQNATDPGAGRVGAAGVKIGSFEGTINAGLAAGTYYLYLGRVLGGIVESPAFRAASFVGGRGTGASVTNTTQFGFGSELPVGTGGAGTNGTLANTLSAQADAIINVLPPPGPNVTLAAGGVNPVLVPGNGRDYFPTLTNMGAFTFAGTNLLETFVAFDLGGVDGVPTNLTLPSGASLRPGNGDAFLFGSYLGGSFDFVVDFGSLGSGPFTAALSNLNPGVTINRIAASGRLLTAPVSFSQAGPNDNAISSGIRNPIPGSSQTLAVRNLLINSGGFFSLGSGETLILNNGNGTLNISPNGVFEGNGTVVGNIFNSGLLIIPITRSGLINQTTGGVITIAPPPVPPPPGEPVVIPAGPTISIPQGTFVAVGGAGFSGGSGGGGGSSGGFFEIGTQSNPTTITTGGTTGWDGQLNVTGSFTQTATGVLRLFIAGDVKGETYSHLSVGQSVSLDGRLQIVLQPELFSFVPEVGDTFDFVTSAIGITIVPTDLRIDAFITESGANFVGLPQSERVLFNSGFSADPNRLFALPLVDFDYALVDGGKTLRLTLVSVVIPEPAATLPLLLLPLTFLRRRRR